MSEPALLPGARARACRWFSTADVEVPEASFLDIILYSREQLVKEYAAMPEKGGPEELPAAPW